MRLVHSVLQDGSDEEKMLTSRRTIITGSLKIASGGALALALAGAPGIARLASAQDDQEDDGGQDDGQGGGGDGGGGGGRGDDGGGGGGRGGGGQDGGGGRGGGQVNGVPNAGVGDGSAGQTAGLIGLAAAGAAAAAVFLRQRSSAEQPTDI